MAGVCEDGNEPLGSLKARPLRAGGGGFYHLLVPLGAPEKRLRCLLEDECPREVCSSLARLDSQPEASLLQL
ncbi:hypothetical protein ANN_01617 [Periplaneta americana]|uniref:Uncharacterized protein n=1 Tax=Periplaneta americana TaxID=6978 RepID=A0ABQ8TY59_PERAM|nr:hypothetical protein ANN_01617 [Periplaneta americana]